MSPLARSEYTAREIESIAQRCRTWGRWGADDDLGHANYLTAERVRSASTLVRSGRTFSLAIPLDRDGPQTGRTARVNPQHVMLRHGGDILADPEGAQGMRSTDDAVYMALQAGTQWDAFCHVFYDGRTYNGRGPETVTSAGASANSITAHNRLAGRGVLLDIPRFLGREHLEPAEAIQAEDLIACADAQGVAFGEGDMVLIRTGHLPRRQGDWGDYAAGPAPGIGVSAAELLCERHVVAAAADTWGLEVVPSESPEVRFPVHVLLLVNAGVLIGEIWDLEALATDCVADRVYEFLLIAQPLPITGAVGSPLNPLAIK